jgi:hypothetical protein
MPMARAAAQRLEDEKERAELKKKKAVQVHEDVHARFAELMRKPLTAPKVPEAEIVKLEQLALARKAKGPSWREFLRTVLTAEVPKGERLALDDLVKVALQQPVPVKRRPDEQGVFKDMIARKAPGEEYDPKAVTDAVRLGILLESKKRINLRKEWVGEEALV